MADMTFGTAAGQKLVIQGPPYGSPVPEYIRAQLFNLIRVLGRYHQFVCICVKAFPRIRALGVEDMPQVFFDLILFVGELACGSIEILHQVILVCAEYGILYVFCPRLYPCGTITADEHPLDVVSDIVLLNETVYTHPEAFSTIRTGIEASEVVLVYKFVATFCGIGLSFTLIYVYEF